MQFTANQRARSDECFDFEILLMNLLLYSVKKIQRQIPLRELVLAAVVGFLFVSVYIPAVVFSATSGSLRELKKAFASLRFLETL